VLVLLLLLLMLLLVYQFASVSHPSTRGKFSRDFSRRFSSRDFATGV